MKLEPLLAAQAKERYAKNVGRPKKSAKNSAEIITPEETAVIEEIADKLMAAGERETRTKLAKIAGVSHDTIAKGKLIEKHADEATKQKLRTNQVSIHRVAKDIKEKQQKESRHDCH